MIKSSNVHANWKVFYILGKNEKNSSGFTKNIKSKFANNQQIKKQRQKRTLYKLKTKTYENLRSRDFCSPDRVIKKNSRSHYYTLHYITVYYFIIIYLSTEPKERSEAIPSKNYSIIRIFKTTISKKFSPGVCRDFSSKLWK